MDIKVKSDFIDDIDKNSSSLHSLIQWIAEQQSKGANHICWDDDSMTAYRERPETDEEAKRRIEFEKNPPTPIMLNYVPRPLLNPDFEE